VRLIVDKREPANFRLPLIEMGFKEKKLKAGDIIIGNMLIERKGSTQFVTDWFSGQLDWQIRNMFNPCGNCKNKEEREKSSQWGNCKKCRFKVKFHPAIIFEWEDLSKIQQYILRLEKHLRKLNWRVLPIYESDGREQTLAWIKEQVEDLKKGKQLVREGIVNPYKGIHKENQDEAIRGAAISALARLPGIGEDRAMAILKRYHTLYNAIARAGSWHKVNGIGTKTADKVEKVMDYRFE